VGEEKMSNYRRGYTFELRVKRSLEKRGYFVVRSSGSHGPVDLLAVSKDGKILGIQCKLDGYLPPKEFRKLLVLASRYPVVLYLASKNENGRVSLKKLE
jgi:Holliday junction resolvase